MITVQQITTRADVTKAVMTDALHDMKNISWYHTRDYYMEIGRRMVDASRKYARKS